MKNYNWRFLILVSLVSAMGGYLFGFDFAVITGSLPFLREQFGLNEYWVGFTTGSLALGCIVGCLIAGPLSEKYGRKFGLMISASVFCVSSLFMAISPGFTFLIFARFAAGIGVGMASMLSPMYIAEISPAEVRGRMVAINQFTIVLGQVVTHYENFLLRDNGPGVWRWMFGLGVIPSLLFFVGVFFLPESPRWLFRKGLVDECRKVLLKIGTVDFVDKTLAAISKTGIAETKVNFRVLLQKSILPIVLIGMGLAAFQQFCGINVVFNYTTNIFSAIGASKNEQLLQAVWISIANLLFTLVAMLLVDKWGRRPLMLLGAGGLAIVYVIIGSLLYTGSSHGLAAFIILAIGIYAMSLAPLTWVLISEIFPNNVRGMATSISVLSLWASYFILVFTFPIIEKKYGDAAVFWGYAVICLIGFVFIYYKIKETKGKSLEEIENDFSIIKH